MTSRFILYAILVLLLPLLGGCTDYPKDVENTLDSIKGGVLQVGVIDNPPWVIRGPSGPEGLEPGIVRELATSLNAEVRWHWGTTGALLHALEHYQLHLVIGGLTTGPRLPKTVASTKPYYTTRYTIGYPLGQDPTQAGLDGLDVAVPYVSPLHKLLKSEGANPRPIGSPGWEDLPAAGPDWRLEADGYVPQPLELLKQKHVMVTTKGENAWIMTVQRHLNGQTGVHTRLRDLEASR